jgi:glucosamine kinase
MRSGVLLLGVDGGGTKCRARLADGDGKILGEGLAGPANIRFGLAQSFSAIFKAANQCLEQAGPLYRDRPIIACLALAGASDPTDVAAARSYPHPFFDAVVTTDARAACVGAHAGRDGGIVIVGTGTIGWGISAGRDFRVGGWGFPVSDEGSGAWLGCEALRRVLWARDGLIRWSSLLTCIFESFGSDPHAVVRWMSAARPREFAGLAPMIIDHALQDDLVARELVQLAAGHIDVIAAGLVERGASRLSLMGGLATAIGPLLSEQVKNVVVPPEGDALSGALRLARVEAERLMRADWQVRAPA